MSDPNIFSIEESGTGLCGLSHCSVSNKWYTGNNTGEIDVLLADGEAQEVDDGQIYAIAISPDGNEMAFSCGSNNSVNIRPLSEVSKSSGLLTRTTLPTHHIEFSGCKHIFISSGEPDVKVLSTTTKLVETTISTHGHGVRGFTVDENGEYIAIVNLKGDLIVYRMVTEKGPLAKQYVGSNVVCLKSGVLPTVVCRDEKEGFRLSFSNLRGSLQLAVPQCGNPMVLTRSYTKGPDGVPTEVWNDDQPLVSIPLDPIQSHGDAYAHLVAFSPNGRYLASCDTNGRVVVWDMLSREVMRALQCDSISGDSDRLMDVCWGPVTGDNYLMLLSSKGCARIEGIVKCSLGFDLPTGEVTVTTSTPAVPAVASTTEESSGTDVVKSNAVSPLVKDKDQHKRVRRASGAPADSDSDDDFGFDTSIEKIKQDAHSVPALSSEAAVVQDSDDDVEDEPDMGLVEDDVDDARVEGTYSNVFIQKPFQPSSTIADEKRRRYLVWNGIGHIVSRYDDVGCHINITFANASNNLKHPNFTDVHDFTMADLSSEGAVFAAPPDINDDTGEGVFQSKTAGSVIYYRSFGTRMRVGSANETFKYVLPAGEGVDALCCGKGWVAVATSASYLRLFSTTGLQLSICRLKGPVVCLCGWETSFAIIYNTGCSSTEAPSHRVDLFDIPPSGILQSVVEGVVLPLSPGGEVEWAAFSETNFLVYLDTNGILSVLLRSMGWQWTPVLNTSSVCRTVDHRAWPVTVKSDRLCYVLLNGEFRPAVHPTPVVTAKNFRLPIVEVKESTRDKSGTGTNERARDMLWGMTQLHHCSAMRTTPLQSVDQSALEEEYTTRTIEMDKALGRYFHECCKKQRISAALDLIGRFSTIEGLAAAMTIANHTGKASLARMVEEVMNERREAEMAAEEECSYSAMESSQYHQGEGLFSETYTQNSVMPPTGRDFSGYGEGKYESPQSPVERRSVLGSKRRDADMTQRDPVATIPVNKFALSNTQSPVKRKNVHDSMEDLKASPSPKKAMLSRDSPFAREARSKRLHDKSYI
mmetsp:Transcript_1873/g.2977  ORF Transcript_1873/g.2977 Transcript_1873/m.2977 type:complete len:1036 (-) Transcript_1873:74-3181(-)